MEIIRTVAELFVEILLTPGLPFRVGIMLGAAIIIGYFLYDGKSAAAKIIAVILLFVSFQEWARASVLIELQGFVPYRPIVFAIISTNIFVAGIAFGVVIAAHAKLGRTRVRENVEVIIEEIKTGAHNVNGES